MAQATSGIDDIVHLVRELGVTHKAQNQVVQVLISVRSIHAYHFMFLKRGKNGSSRVLRFQGISLTTRGLHS